MFRGQIIGTGHRFALPLFCLMAFVLVGCGGDGASQGPSLPPPPQNSAPSAIISNVPDTEERTTITVDGSGSSDSDGSISTYVWSLTNPSDFEISLAVSNEPTTEIEIGEVADDVTLELSLTVMDNQGATASASTLVFVEEIDFDLLPPDPGAIGQATVEGVDSDFDGIRDDVEIAIYFLNELNTPKREAMNMIARGYQGLVLSGVSADRSEIDAATLSTFVASTCLRILQNQENQTFLAYKERAIIESLMVNTQDRFDVFQIADSIGQSSDFFFESPTSEQCQNL